MTKQEIIDFMRANQVSYLATVENGEPRVRGMAHYVTKDGRIVYHTGKMKDLGMQLAGDPIVETVAFDSKTQVRINARAKTVNDSALIEEVFAERPFLKQIAEAIGVDNLVFVELVDCKACTWTMETNMAPKEWVEI